MINVRFEPIAEVPICRCERMQHGNLLRRLDIVAAWQRRLRPFRLFAANQKPRIHTTCGAGEIGALLGQGEQIFSAFWT